MKCAQCGNAKLRHTTEKHRIQVAKVLFLGKLPVLECAECGESYTDAEALQRFERGIARHLAQKGPAIGETFRFMRKAIGLPAREVAHLLSTTPETVSRWEKGARAVDTCAWTTLASLVLDELEGRHDVRDRLLALKTKRPAKTGPIEVTV